MPCGGAPPPSAVGSLYAYIARLRRALGPAGSMLRSDAGGYALQAPPEQVDLWQFDTVVAEILGSNRPRDAEQMAAALEPALSWWRGPLLDGWDQPWVVPHRARLQERRMSAIEALADAYLQLGRNEAAIRRLEDAVAEQPHREGSVRLLMLGLYRAGRQADALAAYTRCHRLLDEDLGVEPSEELRDLHLAVLEQRPELRWQPGRQRAARRVLPLRNPRFHGRDQLTSRITEQLAEHRVVAAVGIGGAGKSVAALEVAHAHQGYACWINAGCEAAMSASVASVAADRGLPLSVAAGHGRALRQAVGDIAGEVNPLFVFDNVRVAAGVAAVPAAAGSRADPGHLPLRLGWGALGAVVRVGSFTADEAAAYLLARTGTSDRVAAEALADDLGRLPLACAQAAAFIEQADLTVARYRELFARRREELLHRAAPDGYGQTVGTTWQLAFEQLAENAPAAATMLEVLAFLSPDGVSDDLIRGLFRTRDPDLDIADAVAQLRRFSLVDRDATNLSCTAWCRPWSAAALTPPPGPRGSRPPSACWSPTIPATPPTRVPGRGGRRRPNTRPSRTNSPANSTCRADRSCSGCSSGQRPTCGTATLSRPAAPSRSWTRSTSRVATNKAGKGPQGVAPRCRTARPDRAPARLARRPHKRRSPGGSRHPTG